ncbi:hypothetical protein [Spiroplasma endosymbiont of Crioceris asparagi]|uniref:hypothetical protein n=1 Tax=Spiroplasma endosymbiont of Crioceris asparagi TaxID=3066286 RepID=UPI0030CC48F3
MGILIEIIFFIDIAIFLFYLSLKISITFIYGRAQVPSINNGSLTVSDKIIQETGDAAIKYLNSDLTFEYSNEYYYSSIYNHLNKKQKKIIVPQWKQVSAGYELDYVLASIWFNAMLFKKNKAIRFWKLVTTTIPSFCRNLFLISAVFIASLYLLDHYSNKMFLAKHHILIEIILLFLLFIFFIMFFIYLFCILYANNKKTIIESMYEKDMAAFFKTELRGYVEDIVAARTYSVNIPKVDFQIIRLNVKTENVKYFGPFAMI